MRPPRFVSAVAAAWAAVAAAAACRDRPAASPRAATHRAPAPAATAATSPGAAADGPLSWRRDDYAGALAEARRRKLPLFVDLWAEWCHTCLSMKHTVLRDPSLAPYADRFVWLALDTDRPGNAPALAKLPVSVWPTLYVVRADDEAILARHLGAASVRDLRALLDDALQAADDGDAAALARAGDRAAAAGDHATAAARYAEAIARAPADWPRRAPVLVAYLAELARAGDPGACVDLALARAGDTGRTAAAADFLDRAADCADALPAGDPRRRQLATVAIARLAALVADADAPLSVDDRADAMRVLRGYAARIGDAAAARRWAKRERALLDEAARTAGDPYLASTYNWPRLEVYMALDAVAELVPDLEASARALPHLYDPPYRLAQALHHLGRHDDALAAAERALERVYGPRKANVLSLIADIHEARGDRAAARAAVEALVAHWESLPDGQRRPDRLAAARKRLAELR
ncbi:MAG: thioredoxin family protein [Deltaproteobacteria bacterium]|nr:MAG: thioredoxin family protein [Deltaproteobacteria bacterium]